MITFPNLTKGIITQYNDARDRSTLLRLEVKRFDNPMNGMLLSHLISKYGTNLFFVVDISGNQRLDAYVFAGYTEKDEIYIFSIVVEEEFEGSKWGSKLVKYLIEILNDPRVETMSLHVETTNIAAIGLYQKFGFVKDHVVRNYYGKNRNAYFMCLKVK